MTKKDNLVSLASEFLNLHKINFQYLNGHTPLDWIRIGYLDEVIARVLKVSFASLNPLGVDSSSETILEPYKPQKPFSII